jgi:hypothetical protein
MFSLLQCTPGYASPIYWPLVCSLHILPIFKPHGDSPLLSSSLQGEDDITWCNVECICYRNPSLRFMTKVRACKGGGREWNLGVTFHAPGVVGECEGMNPRTSKWVPTLGVGVLMDFRIFKKRFQGSKLIKLKSSLYHWKLLETWMSKISSHDPFGYLKHKMVKTRVRSQIFNLTVDH